MDALVARNFRKTVLDYYKHHGRHDLPWRCIDNPYHIWVSELMLQQTQVIRVLPKYEAFIKRFPTLAILAKAPLKDVLYYWQGLGYNRRALYLHKAAQALAAAGRPVPHSVPELMKLPGIGSYTAQAIATFAYHERVVMIETNIRTVYLYHFFQGRVSVSDQEILSLVERTLPKKDFRHWYYALMDYGVYLKSKNRGINTQSKHYSKQTKFDGSNRQLRGAILKALLHEKMTLKTLCQTLSGFTKERISVQLYALADEGMVIRVRNTYELPT
jgi:A/G-specific adenine glycosylase